MTKTSSNLLKFSVAAFLFVMGIGLGSIFTTPGIQNQDVSYSVSATTRPSNYYSTSEGVIFKGTQPIKLKGANWFGFETPDHVVHGLWSRGYKQMINEMKGMGINSLRIPVCPATLNGSKKIGSINFGETDNNDFKNQDGTIKNSLEILDIVLQELNRNQIYILLDMHRIDPNCGYISDLWYVDGYSEQQWIQDLQMMADRYSNLEYLMGIDLKNEPHGAATWGTGNSSTDWNTAAEKAGKAVIEVNPKVLIFVEGVQENPTCSQSNYNHWWGGNLEPFACDPIDPEMVPKSKLVLSPHVYGPDVYNQPYFNVSNFPANMPAIWDQHFGYLVDQGYTIVPGEWGGRYEGKDKVWQDAMVTYFNNKQICNSFYWSWNPNSGDTGGILQDDWRTIHTSKKNMLQGYWDSCQLPSATISPIEIPGTPIDPPTNPENGVVCAADIRVCADGTVVKRDPKNACQFPNCPPPAVSGTSSSSSSSSSQSSSTQTSSSSSSQSSSTTSSSTSSAPIMTTGSVCDVTYKIVNQWNNGFVAEVVVKNNRNATVKDWNLKFNFPGNQAVSQIWNGRVSQAGKQVTVNYMNYNREIKSGNSVSFGFVGKYSGNNQKLNSMDFNLNGSQCGVKSGGVVQPAPVTPPAPPTSSNYCEVDYKVVSQWANGFVADVKVKNISGVPIDGWNLTWTFPGNQNVVNSWNTQFGQTGKNVSAKNANYNGTISAGASTTFGFQATYNGQNGPIAGTQFKLNGQTCK